jgi:hypothetical protein
VVGLDEDAHRKGFETDIIQPRQLRAREVSHLDVGLLDQLK